MMFNDVNFLRVIQGSPDSSGLFFLIQIIILRKITKELEMNSE